MSRETTKQERELATIEDRQTKIVADIERAEAELATATNRRSEVEEADALVVLGELDAKAAEKRRVEVEGAIAKAEARVRALRAAHAELARRSAAGTEQLRLARRDEQAKKARAAREEENGLADAVRDRLEEAARLSEQLEEARQRTRAEGETLSALCATGEDVALPQEQEPLPEHATLKALSEFLETAGKRRRSRAGAAAHAEAMRRDREQAEDEERANRYIWSGDHAALEQITNAFVAEKARTARAAVCRRARREFDQIFEDVRSGRSWPERARDELAQLTQVPKDVRREAEAELAELAKTELARAG